MRNGIWLMFLVLWLNMMLLLSQMNNPGVVVISEREFLKQQQEITRQKEAQIKEEALRAEEICRTVVVKYDVEYGSIYTGDQTPIKHLGVYQSKPICSKKYYTPAIALLPYNMAMPLALNDGRRCDLWLPFFRLLNGEPFGFLTFYEGGKSVKMIIYARIKESEDDLTLTIFVKATPATEEQWDKNYRG